MPASPTLRNSSPMNLRLLRCAEAGQALTWLPPLYKDIEQVEGEEKD